MSKRKRKKARAKRAPHAGPLGQTLESALFNAIDSFWSATWLLNRGVAEGWKLEDLTAAYDTTSKSLEMAKEIAVRTKAPFPDLPAMESVQAENKRKIDYVTSWITRLWGFDRPTRGNPSGDAYAREIQRRIAEDGYTPALVAALHRQLGGDPDEAVDSIWVSSEWRFSSNRSGARILGVELLYSGLSLRSVWLATALRIYREVHGYSIGRQVDRDMFLRMIRDSRDNEDPVDGPLNDAINFAQEVFFGSRRVYRVDHVRIPSDQDLEPAGGWQH